MATLLSLGTFHVVLVLVLLLLLLHLCDDDDDETEGEHIEIGFGTQTLLLFGKTVFQVQHLPLQLTTQLFCLLWKHNNFTNTKARAREQQTASFSTALRSMGSAAVSGKRPGHTSIARSVVPSATSRTSPAASSTVLSVPTASSQTPPAAVRRLTVSVPVRSCRVRVVPRGKEKVRKRKTNAGLADSEPVVRRSDSGNGCAVVW